jgi:hypothetical protein
MQVRSYGGVQQCHARKSRDGLISAGQPPVNIWVSYLRTRCVQAPQGIQHRETQLHQFYSALALFVKQHTLTPLQPPQACESMIDWMGLYCGHGCKLPHVCLHWSAAEGKWILCGLAGVLEACSCSIARLACAIVSRCVPMQ